MTEKLQKNQAKWVKPQETAEKKENDSGYDNIPNSQAMEAMSRDKDEDMTEFIQSVKLDKAWSKQYLISSRHGINRIRFFAETESSSV